MEDEVRSDTMNSGEYGQGFAQFARSVCDRIDRAVVESPGTATAVTFAAGIGIGALVTRALMSASEPDPFLTRLGKQAMNGMQNMVPEQWSNFLSKNMNSRHG